MNVFDQGIHLANNVAIFELVLLTCLDITTMHD